MPAPFGDGIYNSRVPHPPYKDHPLWIEAMALVEAAYALAETAKGEAPLVARHLRQVSVAIPSSIADALADEPEHEVIENRTRALGALAEIERQTLALPDALAGAGDALAARARKLYREVSRQLATEESFS